MSRDGNGQYTLPSGNPVTPGTVIESEWANTTLQDVANALSTSIAYDGQTVPVNNLPMGGYRHTNVSDPSQRSQYVTLGMSQDGRDTRVVLTSGTNDLVGTLVGQMSAYYPGQILTFQALATNTGAMTLNVNGIGVRAMQGITGSDIAAGQIVAGKVYQVLFNGTAFQVLNASAVASLSSQIEQNSISGWTRPADGAYPPITLVNPTTIRVPEGKGYIVPPGDVASDEVTEVNWVAQDVVLQYLTTAFTTTIAIDASGTVVQIPDQVLSGVYRNNIILGVVSHVTDVVTGVVTRPEVHGDDGYLFRDLTRFLSGLLATGGQVSQSGVNPLSMDVQEGIIFIPGGAVSNPDSPNFFSFPTQTAISFLPLAGQQTLGAATTHAPVGNYDPNFTGVITAIPGATGTAVIHRLYWQNGTYIWVYGQRTYATKDLAIQNLAYERAIFKVAKGLAGATLICEIAATKGCLAIGDAATCTIVPRGGFEYVIGSAGGLDEAPQDGNLYGRKDAAWSQVLDPSSATFLGDVTIQKPQPVLVLDYDPTGAGWGGVAMRVEGAPLFDMRYTLPDKELSFRTYDDLGVLESSTVVEQSGDWTFPASVTATLFGVGLAGYLGSDVDSVIVAADTGNDFLVTVNGGTVTYTFNTGGITIPVAPTAPTHAATKGYVDNKKESLVVALGSESAVATTGVKITFRAPYALTLTDVKASLNVAQTAGALFTIDVTVNGVSIFSTLLTFNNGSKTTVGATTPAVIANANVPADAEIIINITQIGDGTAIGPKLTLIGHQ